MEFAVAYKNGFYYCYYFILARIARETTEVAGSRGGTWRPASAQRTYDKVRCEGSMILPLVFHPTKLPIKAFLLTATFVALFSAPPSTRSPPSTLRAPFVYLPPAKYASIQQYVTATTTR